MKFRTAIEADLPAIVRMLDDDDIGRAREGEADPPSPEYVAALAAIRRQDGNAVIVAEDGGQVVGCLQLTFIPGLARLGMTRALIEGVRVDRAARGKGIGEALFRHAIELARQHGCGLVQLTADKRRKDAHRFYERLGFVATHEGMKLAL